MAHAAHGHRKFMIEEWRTLPFITGGNSCEHYKTMDISPPVFSRRVKSLHKIGYYERHRNSQRSGLRYMRSWSTHIQWVWFEILYNAHVFPFNWSAVNLIGAGLHSKMPTVHGLVAGTALTTLQEVSVIFPDWSRPRDGTLSTLRRKMKYMRRTCFFAIQLTYVRNGVSPTTADCNCPSGEKYQTEKSMHV